MGMGRRRTRRSPDQGADQNRRNLREGHDPGRDQDPGLRRGPRGPGPGREAGHATGRRGQGQDHTRRRARRKGGPRARSQRRRSSETTTRRRLAMSRKRRRRIQLTWKFPTPPKRDTIFNWATSPLPCRFVSIYLNYDDQVDSSRTVWKIHSNHIDHWHSHLIQCQQTPL